MSRRTHINVLVVDSDARTHVMCQSVFPAPAHRVRIAGDGATALAAVREQAPDVLITELTIGGIDGLTVIDHARRANSNVVAIILTAEPSALSAVRALRLKVEDYVIKHTDSIDHLRNAVREGLKRQVRAAESDRLMGELTSLADDFFESIQALKQANRELAEKLAPPPTTMSIRILVVDDERPIVALLETLLRSQGYEVLGADSARSARERLAESPFDLILTDQELGDGTGLDVAAEAQARYPEVDVLVMTGYATLDSAVEAVNLGLAGYLKKPFKDLDFVLNRVDEVLTKARQKRAERRYFQGVHAQNTDFIARYRLLKTKLATLQREHS